MLNKLLFKLCARLPCRLIKLDDKPYLERYYIGQLFGATFYLHRFLNSDGDRHVHNHPWGWGRALVLLGGYWEESAIDICATAGPSGCVLKKRQIWLWNRVGGSHFHRISNVRPGTWTLFFHGPRLDAEGKEVTRPSSATNFKGWGFLEEFKGMVVFQPYESSSPSHWWKTAPKGAYAGRQALCVK